MKHTQGEWKVNYFISNLGILFVESVGRQICDLSLSKQEKIERSTWKQILTEEEIANAKLIAAAPELLEALVDIKILYMDDKLSDYLQPYQDAWKRVQEAIKKAT